MNPYQTLSSSLLNDAGLNCQAVFDIADLSIDAQAMLIERCPQALNYRQMILIGHGGQQFWQSLLAAGTDISTEAGNHPIDDFAVSLVRQFFDLEHAGTAYEIIYPGAYTVSLQELGKLAGWHHDSPFMVGINTTFGSWFAYRAMILANTHLPPTTPVETASPCHDCGTKICIQSCPAQALDDGEFHLLKCVYYRQQEDSRCKDTCVARVSCPVAGEHRYSEQQINYHYSRSMRVIAGMVKL
ncbi:hypothetical protein [Undibacterium sp. Di24W]|uniref:hypothetical protein n=1 Tax=Undibacterium sp. Di24W TaxID=3413033 RepID=UPI003BF2767F